MDSFRFARGALWNPLHPLLYHEIGRTMTVKDLHKMEPQLQKDCDLRKLLKTRRQVRKTQKHNTAVANTSKTNDFAKMQASPIERLMQEWQES